MSHQYNNNKWNILPYSNKSEKTNHNNGNINNNTNIKANQSRMIDKGILMISKSKMINKEKYPIKKNNELSPSKPRISVRNFTKKILGCCHLDYLLSQNPKLEKLDSTPFRIICFRCEAQISKSMVLSEIIFPMSIILNSKFKCYCLRQGMIKYWEKNNMIMEPDNTKEEFLTKLYEFMLLTKTSEEPKQTNSLIWIFENLKMDKAISLFKLRSEGWKNLPGFNTIINENTFKEIFKSLEEMATLHQKHCLTPQGEVKTINNVSNGNIDTKSPRKIIRTLESSTPNDNFPTPSHIMDKSPFQNPKVKQNSIKLWTIG